MLDFRKLWDEGLTFEAFVASCKAEHCGLWQGIYKLARVPDWALAAVPPGTNRKLLVIAEDWCGDASNTVPIIARFVDPGSRSRAASDSAGQISRGDGSVPDQRLALDPDRDRAG